MSETLWAVIIGGVIASIAPTISLYYENRKLSKDLKIQRLREKRAKLESTFQKIIERLDQSIEENDYSMDLVSDFQFLVPKNVDDAFIKFLEIRDKKADKDDTMFHHYTIIGEMKNSLAKIDNEIDCAIN